MDNDQKNTFKSQEEKGLIVERLSFNANDIANK
jgi:hypothetical protein